MAEDTPQQGGRTPAPSDAPAHGAAPIEGYLRHRRAGLVLRLGAMAFAAAVAGLIVPPLIALLAFCVVAVAQLAEAFALPRLAARAASGRPSTRAVEALAVLEALSVSAAVAILWSAAPYGSGLAFVLSVLLAGAAFEAGESLGTLRRVALMRIGAAGLTLLGLLTMDLVRSGAAPVALTALAAGLLLCAVVAAQIRRTEAQTRRLDEASAALRTQHAEMEAASTRLRAEQDEVRKLSLVARNASDSVTIADAAGRIQWVNRSFSRLTGIASEAAIGRTRAELLYADHTAPEAIAALDDALAWTRPHRTEICIRHRDAGALWVETTLIPVPGGDGQTDLIIAIDRDISENRQDEAFLQSALDAALDAGEAQEVVLDFLDRDLRDRLQATAGEGEGVLLRRLDALVALIRRDPALVVARPEAFGLDACLSDVVRKLRPRARRKGLFIDLNFADDAALRLTGDARRLRELTTSLLLDAIETTDKGGVAVQVRHRPNPEGHTVALEITGTGPHQPSPGATPPDGIDGLAIHTPEVCGLLARYLGGDLGIRTDPASGGLRADLSLRFAPDTSAAESGPDAARQARPPADMLAGARILIAEDRLATRVLLEQALARLPVTLFFAEGGAAALHMARAERPDLVLLGADLPDTDQIETARDLVTGSDSPPCVIGLLPARAGEAYRLRAAEAGIAAVLAPPLERDCVVRTVAMALETRGRAA